MISTVYKSRDQSWRDWLNSFTAALYKKVGIDKHNTTIKPIHDGTNTIVEQIANGLKLRIPQIYRVLEVATGSKTSGFKVGLTHEADYLINEETYGRNNTIDVNEILCNDIANVIDDGIMSNEPGLRIHGIYRYTHVPGICIVMA